ncbi:carbohydrate-binding protein [uncultured Aquimarina sp.]|uniref:carbohydrate-binding protein n=1 Tax=uncultured Aquimarina sp. TaxID=575652 RepID=UPI002626BB18|nr:carbohydrate-binding protein [uncultured Aquimarina sp.]
MIFSKRISRILALILFLIGGNIFARDIYVSKSGNDINTGTIDSPYLTIAKAASEAVAGDTVFIREGTYEETLSPANSGAAGSPIVFTSFPGEKVIITAMEALSGWTQDSGVVYKTKVDWDLGQENFVLNGDVALDLARWPNNDDGKPFTLNSKRNDGGSGSNVINNAFLTSSEIPAIDWTGGSVFFYGDKPGSGWIAWKAFITSSTSGRVNFVLDKNPDWIRTFHAPADGGDFYLEGVKAALDYQNEWWFDKNTKELFVQLPNGTAPQDGMVSMRKREITINLNGRSYIEVRNLAVFGGAIELKTNSNNNILFGISSFYGNHTQGIFRGFNAGKPSVEVNGTRNSIEKCEIAFSAATGVRLGGNFNELKNNYIHDFNYLGSYDAPLVARGGTDNKILRNTIFNGGRDGINYNGNRCEIAYNDVYKSNLIADDCGTFYTVGGPQNTEIHHNWFHDTASRGSKRKAAGIYLDNDAEAFSVHHNVVWNTEWAGVQINWDGKDIDVFNNTFYDNSDEMGAWHKEGTSFTNVKVWNNLGFKGEWEPQSDKQNNLVTDPSAFENPNMGNFYLKNESGPIDQGRVITGITDGFIGANPDVGAYENGGERWVAGILWDPRFGPTGNGCYGLPGETCESCTTPSTWYADVDNDGLGDLNDPQSACTQPSGYVTNADDACPVDNLNTCTIIHELPGIIEAEEYTLQQGVQREDTSDNGGGMNIGFIENGDYTEYQSSVETTGMYIISIRVASGSQGGTITILSDGTSLGSINVDNTGDWQTWQTINTNINLTSGTQNIRLVYSGGVGFLLNLNSIEFSLSTLSIDNFNRNLVNIYPNPVQNSLFIQGLKSNQEFSIVDITGRVVKQFYTSDSQEEIDVSKLIRGLYLLRDKATNFSYKFVKN